jgi:uncharacterized membrane protein YidH (DUF202 family)
VGTAVAAAAEHTFRLSGVAAVVVAIVKLARRLVKERNKVSDKVTEEEKEVLTLPLCSRGVAAAAAAAVAWMVTATAGAMAMAAAMIPTSHRLTTTPAMVLGIPTGPCMSATEVTQKPKAHTDGIGMGKVVLLLQMTRTVTAT